MENLIDDLYEAAFVPDRWVDVLERMCRISGSASASMVLFEGPVMRRWKTTARVVDAALEFAAMEGGQHTLRNPDRPDSVVRGDGFYCADDLLTPRQRAEDPVDQVLRPLGLGWQLSTGVMALAGDTMTACIGFDRHLRDGRHCAAEVAVLNRLHPDLNRATLLARRLGTERCRGALDALAALELPAALLDARGRLREPNALLTPSLLDVRGGARVVLNDPHADAQLAALLANTVSPRAGSIPLPARGARPACIAHLVPLADSVRDPFSSGALLLFFSTAARPGHAPDPRALRTLFNLSPAESRLASALAGGLDLSQAAKAGGIQFSTARSYLERIFDKTGCHRQSELVRVLGGIPAMRAPSAESPAEAETR
ncbi:MAG: hypothetical protein ABI589_00220 [Burkholderiales bacterium]